jgi:lambda family phage minor tail protein L
MSEFRKTEGINKELFSINPSLMVEFFVISDIANTSDVIRLHGGISEFSKSIFFGGAEYFYIPYNSEGFNVKSDGTLSRPTLGIINASGFFSSYIKNKDDLVGAKVQRIRTFLKFLDAVNFKDYQSNPDAWKTLGVNPDPESRLQDETWIINRKIQESKVSINYELTSPLDLENAYVPNRQILNNYCAWKYRGINCGYSGPPVADANNGLFGATLSSKGAWQEGQGYAENDFVHIDIKDGNITRQVVYVCISDHTSSNSNKPSINTEYWATDACSKSLTACKMRFKGGKTGNLPFGGFPASRLF